MKIVPDTHDDVYTNQEDDIRRDKLMDMAIIYGAKVGAVTLAVSSIGTYVVNQRYAAFRNYASINGKVSIPLIISMFITSVVTELAIHDARSYPEKWDGGKPFITQRTIAAAPTDAAQLSYPKQALLKIYDYPLVFAGVLALPVAGNIMATRFAKNHLTFSQALMQTRVFAQFGIISILLSTVSVRAFVEANDHFGCRHKHLTDEDRYARGWAEAPHGEVPPTEEAKK
jgi:hypothetical protein